MAGAGASSAVTHGARRLFVRDSTAADIAAVERIYAEHVLTGLASFEIEPPSVDELLSRRAIIVGHSLPHLVAEFDGSIVGYSYAAPYRSRPAYRFTVEDSVYVAAGSGGHGIGRALLSALIDRCETGPWRQMIAIIGDSGNAASIALHSRLGFRHVGAIRAAGFKFGRWVDSVLMQRPLGAGDQALPDAPTGSGPEGNP
jgi:L-amino acid N-acyltransferase YncA